MTQEKANKIFETDLGQQLLEIFSTSDDKVFIRRSEAIQHIKDSSLKDEEILMWFPEN